MNAFERRGGLLRSRFGKQNAEFISTQSSNQIARSERRAQQLSDLAEHVVCGFVAEDVEYRKALGVC